MKIKKVIQSKTFIIVLAIFLIILTIIGFTYAWFTWRNADEENTNLTFQVGDVAQVKFLEGNEINATLNPVYNYIDGEYSNFSLLNKVSDGSIRMNVYLDIISLDSELEDESFKYILKEVDGPIIASGNFLDYTEGDSIPIVETYSLDSGESSFELILYIDGNIYSSSSMMNKNFEGEINITITEETSTAGTFINNLFNKSAKDDTKGINNGITYLYATDAKLMMDRYGDGTNGQDSGNIRYYGDNPSNYINFNCSNYETQEDCELWRIIGLFDGNLKIMRNSGIGNDSTFSWDFDYNEDTSLNTYSNDWSGSSLNSLLNNQYYSGNSTVTYYNTDYQAINISEKTIDFSTDGLKNNTTRNLIVDYDWGIGKINASLYANTVYNAELQSSYNAKVGLISASDIAYSRDFTDGTCTTSAMSKMNKCGTSWLTYSQSTWTISALDSSSDATFYFKKTDGSFANAKVQIGSSYTARPVVYLSENIAIKGGQGTESSPYQIGINNN